MIGERVFLRDINFKDGFELRPFRRELREFKPAPFLEADEEDAFAVLRHDAPRIYDLIINGVAERLGQRVVDDLKRAALIVAAEVFHVLQHERRGPVVINDFGQREEEVALFLVLEAVLFAEAQFLGDARDAERLAGKSGAQDVVRGNVRHGHGMNVTVRSLAVIGLVGDLGHLVPVGGENALPARALEGEPEAANAAEQIYEPSSLSDLGVKVFFENDLNKRAWKGSNPVWLHVLLMWIGRRRCFCPVTCASGCPQIIWST